MSEADRRPLQPIVVYQHPLDGRCQVSAGGDIGERLMATGARHYGDTAPPQKQLEEVRFPPPITTRRPPFPAAAPFYCSATCRTHPVGVYG